MARFVLEKIPEKVMEIVIDDKSYNVPLGESLTFKEAQLLETPEGTREFMGKFIPEKVLSSLKIVEYNTIIEAWRAESSTNRNVGE